MYDFAHGQSDFFEGVTHSLCTLEFVPHRPLYDLFVDWVKEGKDLDDNRPHQYEFNKLNLSYTLMSKRNLLTLVKEGLVNGWDDPRMPTICGLRRRGYTLPLFAISANASAFPRQTAWWIVACWIIVSAMTEGKSKGRYGCA